MSVQITFDTIEIYEGPDRNGKYHYALFWHPGGGNRARVQHFRSTFPSRDHVKEWKDLREDKRVPIPN
jgi:hypothetical protein